LSETPTLQDIAALAAAQRVAAMHTCIPATVLSYDGDTQTITAKPAVQVAFRDEAGAITQEDLPNIPSVPVAFPSAAGYSLVWPLSPGDPVTLIFAERSTDEWRSTGEDSNTPQSLRRFNLSDAIAIPGGVSPAAPVPGAGVDGNAMVIRGTLIKLGSASASDFIALSTLVKNELDKIWTKFNTHVHGGVTSGPSVTAVPGDVTGSASSVAATKVQAE
jgi:hypothetical protein